MAPKKKASAAEDAPMFKAQYVLRLEHIQALRQEALRRAEQTMAERGRRNTPRADASGVLREILDAWIEKGKR